ncbi:hypothetical protein B5S31_g3219 [[Candida] boidinii]|nr:hypothetical protein B5S31_g3219 [[Candida] boidinii]
MSTQFSHVLGVSKPNDLKNEAIQRSELQKQKSLRRSNALQTGSSFRPSSNGLNSSYGFQMSGSNGFIKNDDSISKSSRKIDMPSLSTTSPLLLANQCISNAIEKDNNTLPLNQVLTAYAIDSYNYKNGESLGPFTRFEKTNIYNIPDEILEQYSNSNNIKNMGLFTEIKKAWISIDNKLIIWNYESVIGEQDYFTIDEFTHPILTVKLVKAKKNVFVDSVNYVLLVSTSMDIHILAIEYTPKKLDISNTGMSVSTIGLMANKFTVLKKTNEIFFTGIGDGENIWKLNYSNTEEWFQTKCGKECLTKSSIGDMSFAYKLLTKIPGVSTLTEPTINSASLNNKDNKTETIIQLEVDDSRNILYTLSSKSIIRAYRLKIVNGKTELGNRVFKAPLDILKELSTSTTNLQSPLLNRSKFKIISINIVSKQESDNLYLIAGMNNGSRLYINGSTTWGDRVTLTTVYIKFPPPDSKFFETVENLKKQHEQLQQNEFMNHAQTSNGNTILSFSNSSEDKKTFNNTNNLNFSQSNRMGQNGMNQSMNRPISSSLPYDFITPQQLKQAQETSSLLLNTKLSKIVSPGMYFGVSDDKLFVSTPSYGILKKSFEYIEDFEFLNTDVTQIRDIFQLSSSINATEKPRGYNNDFASQYVKTPLEIGVLTATGLHIYRYRTPDLILEDSLTDKTFKDFSLKYGSEEACSTALYLACKFGKSELSKNIATKLYISGGENSKLDKLLTPVIDNVELSDRFYGVLILLSRLVREFWNKEVFKLNPKIKYGNDGFIDINSVKELKDLKSIIVNLTIKKSEIEYFLCSLLIIINFFEENKKNIPGLSPPNSVYELNKEKEKEICLQADHIGFNAILKLLSSLKEGLSFLLILLDDDSSNLSSNKSVQSNFIEIMSYLSLQAQVDLSCITFSEFFTSTDPYITKLIKEVLSSIINRSIVRGYSVEFVAKTLQERCGSFCSTGDVLIFKAIESLKKAKDYSGDNEMKLKYLQSSVKLLEQTKNSLNSETITEAITIMLQLDYYDGAVEFLLNLATNSDSSKLALQYSTDGGVSSATTASSSTLLSDDLKKNAYNKRIEIYNLIFEILIAIDSKAIESIEQISKRDTTSNNTYKGITSQFLSSTSASVNGKGTGNNPNDANNAFVDAEGNLITFYSQLRDTCYNICFKFSDKLFHYEFYLWFISQGIGEKLLDIDTPYILEFLESYSTKDLEMAKLLWIYQSRRQNYFAAAQILYELSISDFEVDLVNRIQFLSRANGFCNCSCPPGLQQDMILLQQQVYDLMMVANVQDELLLLILSDERISDIAKQKAIDELNGEVLTISDLYNDYIEPLGYYELSLITFKVSDYRNSEDILSEWEAVFNKWFYECIKNQEVINKDSVTNEPFYSTLTNKFVILGSRLNDTETLFPISELFDLLAKYMYDEEYNGPGAKPESVGLIIDTFIKSGISYSKLYYTLKDKIECTTFEKYEGYSKVLTDEMCYLIKTWYKNEKRLRDIFSNDIINNMTTYSTSKDPINKYIKENGTPL